MKESSPPSTPRAGDVLIAHPDMPANLFSETLVFLHTHDQEGSLGLILNRPSGRRLGEMIKKTDLPDPLRNLEVYFGGPVQQDQLLLSLFVCNPLTHQFSCELNPDGERLLEIHEQPESVVRAFVGYAGWTQGQLEEELSRRDWLWTAPDEVMVSPRPAPVLWQLLARGDYRWQKLRDYLPGHPERN